MAGAFRPTVSGATAHELEFRDGTHGLVAWGLAVLLVAAITFAMPRTAGTVEEEETGMTTSAVAQAAPCPDVVGDRGQVGGLPAEHRAATGVKAASLQIYDVES